MTKQKPDTLNHYGAQKLSFDEIMKLKPEKRKQYMGTLSGTDKHEILMSLFVNNLNNPDNHDRTT